MKDKLTNKVYLRGRGQQSNVVRSAGTDQWPRETHTTRWEAVAWKIQNRNKNMSQ